MFLSLEASFFLFRSIGARPWGVEGDQLLVARGEGIVRCSILPLVGDGRINGMSRARADTLLEDCMCSTYMCVCRGGGVSIECKM